MISLQLSVSDSDIRSELKKIVAEVLEELLKNPDILLSSLSAVAPDELHKNNPLLNGSEENYFLTRKEVSEMLKVSLVTLNNWQKKNILIPNKIGKRILYNSQDVKKAMQKQETSS